MICYRDSTFCVSPGCTDKCGRKLTPEIIAAAQKWWGGFDAPIAMGRFCDKPQIEEAAVATASFFVASQRWANFPTA